MLSIARRSSYLSKDIIYIRAVLGEGDEVTSAATSPSRALISNPQSSRQLRRRSEARAKTAHHNRSTFLYAQRMHSCIIKNGKGTHMSIFDRYEFLVAERDRRDLALLRWTLVIIFLWFGAMKFTAYEADAIAPLIGHSPIMGWLSIFGMLGQSYLIGVIELSTAFVLILGAFRPVFSALGALMSAGTYLITLTFFVTTPGVGEPTAGGFPALSAMPGQFLLKDAVLLAASLVLLRASIRDKSAAVPS